MSTRGNAAEIDEWIIYARKSGPGDKSVADQERVGRRDIESIGGRVKEVFSDNLSASRFRKVQERPGFQAASKMIEAGGARRLWTFAANRAHRDLDDYVPLRRLCIQTGTLWRYGGRTYDLSTTADRRTVNADALRAEEYSDDLADAVNRGVGLALEDGKPHGRLPRGYRIIRDELTGKPIERVPIPEQAIVIQWAAEQVIDGISMLALAEEFGPRWDAAGGKPFAGRTVDPKVLRKMLMNPTYAGLRTHRGEVRRAGTWQAILDVDTHQKVVQILNDAARTKHRGTAPRYLCSYIAECEVCGDRVGAKLPRAKGRVLPPTYRCAAGHVSRGVKRVDDHVETFLVQMLDDPKVAERLANPPEGGGSIDVELATIAQIRKETDEYVKQAARTRMPARLVAIYTDEMDQQIREAQARIEAITGAYASKLLRDLAEDPRGKWEDYDLLQRREVLRQTVRIVIKPMPPGAVAPGRTGPINVDVVPAGALRRAQGGPGEKRSLAGKRWPSWYAEGTSDADPD